MDRSSTIKTFWSWRKLALVFLLVYFSQVYPYVHFHPSHDNSGFALEISMHPIDVEADASTDHHEAGHHHDEDGHHHHHSVDQATDWYAVRASARYTVSTVNYPVYVVGPSFVPRHESRSYAKESADQALPDSVPLDSFLCRGPPTLA